MKKCLRQGLGMSDQDGEISSEEERLIMKRIDEVVK